MDRGCASPDYERLKEIISVKDTKTIQNIAVAIIKRQINGSKKIQNVMRSTIVANT